MLRVRLFPRILRVGVLVVSIYALCAAPEAILHTGPGTTLDGEAAFDGMRIFGGQLLRTPAGQFSELLLPGNSIRLLGGSSSTYYGDSTELLSGGVALNTSTRFAVHSEHDGGTCSDNSRALYGATAQ
jgi:hypothetical protein